MNHHRKSHASCRRRLQQTIRPSQPRYTHVGLLPTVRGSKPMIVLCGDWLRESGFGFNQRVKVMSSQGKIIIEKIQHESQPTMYGASK